MRRGYGQDQSNYKLFLFSDGLDEMDSRNKWFPLRVSQGLVIIGFRKPFPSPNSHISNKNSQWEQYRSWLRRLVPLKSQEGQSERGQLRYSACSGQTRWRLGCFEAGIQVHTRVAYTSTKWALTVRKGNHSALPGLMAFSEVMTKGTRRHPDRYRLCMSSTTPNVNVT